MTYVDMFIQFLMARECPFEDLYHILREASASLLVLLYRAFQSLKQWNGQKVQTSRILYINQSKSDEKVRRQRFHIMKKILFLLLLFVCGQSVCKAVYKDSFEVNVGDTFTIDGGNYKNLDVVFWTYDKSVFETVDVDYYSTKAKFKAIGPCPKGSVIQATVWYYKDNTTSSGMNKDVIDWKIYVADDGSESTVSLPLSMDMNLYETQDVVATPGNPKYSGKYTWSSSNHFIVEIIDSNENTAKLRANSVGSTYIHVKLDNGNTDAVYVTVKNNMPLTVSASPSSGTYDKGTKIYLSASQSSATIRYTTDGTTPTSSSPKYSSYIILNDSFTLKARAYDSSSNAGEVLTCNYTVKNTPVTVSASPSSGTYDKGTKIYLSASQNSATIRYTTDGTTPTSSSPKYTSYITLNDSFSLKARAYDSSGNAGEVLTCNYTVRNTPITVSASPSSGTYDKGTKIYLTASQNSATIRYTTDGTTPTSSSPKYTSYITLNDSFSLKARAYDSSGNAGEVLTCNYTVKTVTPILNYNILSEKDKTVELIAPNLGQYHGNIDIPSSVKIGNNIYNVVQIGANAFYKCSELTNINLPNTITTIENSAFYGCSNLTCISIPSSVKKIFGDAFWLTSIKSVYITDLKKWCNIEFQDNSAAQPLCLGADLFLNNEKVVDLMLPEGIRMNFAAFYGCKSIESVTFPTYYYGFTDGRWFQYCYRLKRVYLTRHMTKIPGYSFANCKALTDVYCEATTPPKLDNGWSNESFESYYAFVNCDLNSVTLHVPKNCKAKYESALGWSNFIKIKEDYESGVDEIYSDDFCDSESIEIFNLNGVYVGDSKERLDPGIYIVRQGNKVKKIAVK